jgi:hypothetical protein
MLARIDVVGARGAPATPTPVDGASASESNGVDQSAMARSAVQQRASGDARDASDDSDDAWRAASVDVTTTTAATTAAVAVPPSAHTRHESEKSTRLQGSVESD